MKQSHKLFNHAQLLIPGGVNSPVRAFRSVGGMPPFIKRGRGSQIWDADGNVYIDYVGSWGPLIAGHAHPEVVKSVQQIAERGLSFGAPTEAELEMASLLVKLVPSMEQVRLVNSGTEATMSAIRVARGYTRRSKIIKFEGCYHGHADALLVKAGSGALTFGQPSSAGVPAETAQHTLVLDFNDEAALNTAFVREGKDLAAVIVEPVVGNANLIAPKPGFLQLLRELCTRHGVVLIFDEVMTGFRVALGGAQALYGITPDMTTLGKVIGGGMPLAAFAGPREVMAKLAPLGPVYQAGTLSGNPVATACGLATLKEISKPGFHEALGAKTRRLMAGLKAAADAAGVPFSVDSEGGMFGFFFMPELPQNYQQVMTTDQARFNRFFHGMLERGVYLAPALYEAGFTSAALSDADLDATLAAAQDVLAQA